METYHPPLKNINCQSLDPPSRLKGIETVAGNSRKVALLTAFGSAFPFEGNGNTQPSQRIQMWL